MATTTRAATPNASIPELARQMSAAVQHLSQPQRARSDKFGAPDEASGCRQKTAFTYAA